MNDTPTGFAVFDMPLRPSRQVYGWYGILFGVVAVLVGIVDLSVLWGVGILGGFVLLCVGEFARPFARPRFAHLVLKEEYQELLTAECLLVGEREELWRGILVGATDYGVAVGLKFEFEAPVKRTAYYLVYQDMLGKAEFGRLRAMVRFL